MNEYDNYRPEYNQAPPQKRKNSNILILLFILSLLANILMAIIISGLSVKIKAQEIMLSALSKVEKKSPPSNKGRYIPPIFQSKEDRNAPDYDPNDPLDKIADPLNIHDELKGWRNRVETDVKQAAEKREAEAREKKRLEGRKNCWVRDGNTFKNCDDPN